MAYNLFSKIQLRNWRLIIIHRSNLKQNKGEVNRYFLKIKICFYADITRKIK